MLIALSPFFDLAAHCQSFTNSREPHECREILLYGEGYSDKMHRPEYRSRDSKVIFIDQPTG